MPSLTRLARYLMADVLRMYGLGLLLFMILQLTDVLSSTVGFAMRYHASAAQLGQSLLALAPDKLNRALVVAVPFAILLSLSRMQKDSEIKAILAAGVRPFSLIWPLVLPFALVGVLAFYNASSAVPAGWVRWYDLIYNMAGSSPPVASQDKYTYAPPGALFYAGKVTPTPDNHSAQLYGVMVQRGAETLTANSGLWDAQAGTWQLDTPWQTVVGQLPKQLPTLTVAQSDKLLPPPPEARKASNAALRAELARGNLLPETRRQYQYTLAARYADPFTPIAFALAAGALGLLFRSRVAAMGAVVVFIATFYVLWWVLMPQLARTGAVSPVVAAWLPSTLYLLLGLGLAWRLR